MRRNVNQIASYRRSVVTLALLLATSPLLGQHGVETVRWRSDFVAARREAADLARPLLIHFWSPSCLPCKRLEQQVFPDADVVRSLNEMFVPLKVNAAESRDLAARFGIDRVPRDVVLLPDGSPLQQLTTPQDPAQYAAQLVAIAYRAEQLTEAAAVASTSAKQTDRFAGPWGGTRQAAMPPGHRYDQPTEPAMDRSRTAGSGRAEASRAAPPQEVFNRYANGEHASPERAENRSGATVPIAPNYAKYATPATATAPAHVNNQHARSSALPDAASSAAAVDPEPVDDSKLPPPLALEGYCPVSLLETDTWKKGDPKYGVIHRGRLYLFATAAEKEKFFANPDQYSPVLAGIDPVLLAESGVPVEGKRAHGVVYRKRVYLFDSEDNLKRFWQQPERYAAPIRQAMEEGKVRKLFR